MTTRGELYARLGMTKPIADTILTKAYLNEEEQIWREDLGNDPHGEPWFVSFHASEFPGDDSKACARRALYGRLDIPNMEPTGPMLRAVAEAGKAMEESYVWRYHRSGMLLSYPPSEPHQMGYEDKEHWLTGSPDAIIYNPLRNRPHVVEIKSKDRDKVNDMRNGKRSFDAAHRKQLLTYIGLTHERSIDLWPEYDECIQGSILYGARDRPNERHEYLFKYNAEFMEQGRAKLKLWQGFFLDEELPERNKDWRWTENPCKYCPVKKLCKQDVKDKVTKLSESNAIKFTKELRPDYDYDIKRKQVLSRWNVKG